jgi:glucose/arabinose dehydrogenase
MPPLSAVRVASGLARPVFVTAPPGDHDRLFVVEQHSGQVKVLRLASGAVNPTPFLTVPGVATGGEQGLLGLAFHPEFANNGLFYVNFVAADNRVLTGITNVRRYRASAADPDVADPTSATTVLTIEQPFENHNGGWLAFGPRNGLLYIATGDGGSANDPGNRAQNLRELLGKMLRIDVNGNDFPGDAARNYAIPAGNPFRNRADARGEIWAYGLRNPWRNSFDRQTGDLYIGDVGQDAVEEVNFQPASSSGGENYGWRPKEGSKPTPDVGDPIPPGVVDPIHEYSHPEGLSVIGGYVYRGAKIPALQGTYVFGDHFTRIWSFRYDGRTVAEFTDRTAELSRDVGPIRRVSSFGEDAAGEIYIVSLRGDVFRIVPAP